MLENRRDARLQVRGRTVSPAAIRAVLAGVIVVLIVGAYYPFRWDPPRPVHNQVTRTAGGALQFGTMNQARTPGTPQWLAAARATGTVEIQLEADPASGGQRAPMMMLAGDTWHADLAFVQDRSRLGVWLLRPGSHATGRPAFAFPRVLRPHQWFSVDVLLSGDRLRIEVNSQTLLARRIPGGALQGWGPGQVALGDAVHGGWPWRGEIRLAEVRTGSYAVNYIRPGALSIPRSYWYIPDHIEPFPPTQVEQWWLALLDLVTFIPVGFLIVWSRRPPVHPLPATLFAAALAVALAAGKFLFHDRHTSLANVSGQVIGGLLGALIAWQLARNGRPTWLRRLQGARRPAPPRAEETGARHAAIARLPPNAEDRGSHRGHRGRRE